MCVMFHYLDRSLLHILFGKCTAVTYFSLSDLGVILNSEEMLVLSGNVLTVLACMCIRKTKGMTKRLLEPRLTYMQ